MIFLDTGFLFALFVEGDTDHRRVQEVFEGFRDQHLHDLLLTTNHVVAETVTLLRKRGHPDPRVRHGLAVGVGEQLLAGVLGRVHRATADEEDAALSYLAEHQDQDYSFVDCLSFVVMDALGSAPATFLREAALLVLPAAAAGAGAVASGLQSALPFRSAASLFTARILPFGVANIRTHPRGARSRLANVMPKKAPPPPPEPPWQVILEDIWSQNRATLEAVESFEGRYARARTEDRARTDGRFDVIEGVLREHSRDIREIKTDVAVLKADVAAIKTDLRRVDGKVDHLSAIEPRVAALERSSD